MVWLLVLSCYCCFSLSFDWSLSYLILPGDALLVKNEQEREQTGDIFCHCVIANLAFLSNNAFLGQQFLAKVSFGGKHVVGTDHLGKSAKRFTDKLDNK